MRLRALAALMLLALLAGACGTESGDAETEPGQEDATAPSSTATSSTPTSSTPRSSTTTTSSTAPSPAPSVRTVRDLEADYESVVFTDVDGDGVDEVLAFDAIEPPVVAAVFEPDPSTPDGLVPVMLDGQPLTLDYSYYTGVPRPQGEAWFGCVDLDGSGVERLARGTFVYDEAAGETRWTLRPVVWAADLAATEGAPVAGAFPAGEWSVSELMPGRRLCKAQDVSVAIAEGCSAENLTAPPTPPALGEAAAATFRAIVDAAVACDFHELDRLAGDEITLSFGGHDDVAAFLAAGEYRWGGEPLRVLVQLLAMDPGFDEDFATWVWPPFWADRPATVDERAEIEAIFGVPFDELLVEDLGYIDYRIGIDTDGEWLYFVAGD